jgi:hypothetical protein
VTRTLFIVSRRHPDLYEYLKERFANDDQVEVILDRRAGAAARQPGAERGAEERRCHPEVDTELESRSHAVVTVG